MLGKWSKVLLSIPQDSCAEDVILSPTPHAGAALSKWNGKREDLWITE